MIKNGLRKTFLYVFTFLLALCALFAFAFIGNDKKAETVTAEAAFSTLPGHGDWSVEGSGSYSTRHDGFGWNSAGEFKLKSTRKAWADKFGLAFYSIKADSTTFWIGLTPDKNSWFVDNGSSLRLEIQRTGASSARVGVWAGHTGLTAFDGLYIDWGGNYENDVYLGKTANGWSLNVNNVEKALSADASNKLNTVLTAYTNRVGYVQIYNQSGGMQFYYVSVLFGMPNGGSGSIDKAPSTFSKVILQDPYWNTLSGSEVAAWSPVKNTQYTVQSTRKMPLNGMEIDLRMAPAEKVTRNIVSFSSLYQHNWYAGTYSIAFNFDYNPVIHGDNSVSLQFMAYTPSTEGSPTDEPIKLTQQVEFKWYETNKFKFYKSKGIWRIELNGEEVFTDAVSSEGMTAHDYFEKLYPYYEDNTAYFQMWGRGNGVDTSCPYDGFVIEYMKSWTAPPVKAVITTKDINFEELQSWEFKTNVQLRVAMNDLFSVSNASDIQYFTTCGVIQSNGVWAYTARGVGEQWVILKCIAGGNMVEKRVLLRFVQGPEVVAPETASMVQEASFENGVMTVSTSGGGTGETAPQQGCGSSVLASSATLLLTAVGAVLISKKRRKD